MAKKRPRPKSKKSTIKPETRASDDELRERLRNFDIRVLDEALRKAAPKSR